MAARRTKAIPHVPHTQVTRVADPAVSRALDQVRDATQTALDRQPTEQTITQNLAIGANVVRHGLGRAAQHVAITPTVASTSFAWALGTSNPHPDRQVIVNVVGVAQPGARIRVS